MPQPPLPVVDRRASRAPCLDLQMPQPPARRKLPLLSDSSGRDAAGRLPAAVVGMQLLAGQLHLWIRSVRLQQPQALSQAAKERCPRRHSGYGTR